MSKPIVVVAALIENNKKYLIARRLTGDELLKGFWEFPGGKVEEGEAETAAIERELNEEFGVIVKAGELVSTNTHKYPRKTIILKLYKCTYISGVFNLRDHSEFLWVTPREFKEYNFAPADVPLIKKMEEL